MKQAEQQTALLEAILAELKTLNAALGPSNVATESHVELLRQIQRTVGGFVFSCNHLLERSEIAADEGDSRLAEALEDTVESNSRKLGNLFAKLEGQDVGGLRIQRTKNSRDGQLWKLIGGNDGSNGNN